MKYTKGTRLKCGDEMLYYIDEIYDEDADKIILICGGNFGYLRYIPEDEAKRVGSSHEDKMLDILVDISATMKHLNQNIEQIQEAFTCQQCSYEECDDCENGNVPPDDLKIN